MLVWLICAQLAHLPALNVVQIAIFKLQTISTSANNDIWNVFCGVKVLQADSVMYVLLAETIVNGSQGTSDFSINTSI